MTSVLLFAGVATIVLFIIIVILIHHGITHPEIDGFFERWFDSKDFI